MMADDYRGKPVVPVADKTSVSSELCTATGEKYAVESGGESRTILGAAEVHKKKATSFQITSVTVQGSRLSNDGGDDSADDLDESHTEDLSSDLLDCSKTTDLDNDQLSEDNSTAIHGDLITFPNSCIPATALTSPTFGLDAESPVGVGLPLTYSVAAAFPGEGVAGEVTLMSASAATPVQGNEVPVVNPLPDHWQHRFKVVKIVSSEPFKRGRWLCTDFTDPPVLQQEAKQEATEQSGGSGTSSGGSAGNSAPADPPSDHTSRVYEIPTAQSDIQISQATYGSNVAPQATMVQTVGVQTSQPLVASSSAESTQSQQPISSQPPQHHQGVQTASTAQVLPQTSASQPVPAVGSSSTLQAQMPLAPPTVSQPAPVQSQAVPHQSGPAVSQPPVSALLDSVCAQPSPSAPSQESGFAVPSHMSLGTNGAENVPIQVPSAPNLSASSLIDILPDALGTKHALVEGEESSESLAALASELSRASGLLPASVISPSSGGSQQQLQRLDILAFSASSGSSTVAIDNKIEQAMDLVKSHLMFAVREEVDVLKEKITELMDRISQLEYENGILKASATPETLTQLSQSQQQPTSQPPAQPPSGVPSAPPVQQQQQQHVTSQMVAPSHQGQLQPSQQQQSSAS